jgi:hypothetical protein
LEALCQRAFDQDERAARDEFDQRMERIAPLPAARRIAILELSAQLTTREGVERLMRETIGLYNAERAHEAVSFARVHDLFQVKARMEGPAWDRCADALWKVSYGTDVHTMGASELQVWRDMVRLYHTEMSRDERSFLAMKALKVVLTLWTREPLEFETRRLAQGRAGGTKLYQLPERPTRDELIGIWAREAAFWTEQLRDVETAPIGELITSAWPTIGEEHLLYLARWILALEHTLRTQRELSGQISKLAREQDWGRTLLPHSGLGDVLATR